MSDSGTPCLATIVRRHVTLDWLDSRTAIF